MVNLGAVGTSEAVLNSMTGVEDKKVHLQMALLKKTLDANTQQAAELMKLLEGKGQVVDIRV